jgi:hypothetical protein
MMLNVVMLNVVAPFETKKNKYVKSTGPKIIEKIKYFVLPFSIGSKLSRDHWPIRLLICLAVATSHCLLLIYSDDFKIDYQYSLP